MNNIEHTTGQGKRPAEQETVRPMSGVRLSLLATAALCMIGLTSLPAHAAERKLISREAPKFPSEALDQGISSGTVKVRLSVAGDGSVTQVDIVESQPQGVFDKVVKRALFRWKYEGGKAETVDAMVVFKPE